MVSLGPDPRVPGQLNSSVRPHNQLFADVTELVDVSPQRSHGIIDLVGAGSTPAVGAMAASRPARSIWRLLMGLVLTVACLSACQPHQAGVDMRNCAKIKVGMSRADVIASMGPPEAESPGTARDELFLYYSTPRLASGPIAVHLAKSKGGYLVDYAECRGQE